jgi:hypothetical protein
MKTVFIIFNSVKKIKSGYISSYQKTKKEIKSISKDIIVNLVYIQREKEDMLIESQHNLGEGFLIIKICHNI